MSSPAIGAEGVVYIYAIGPSFNKVFAVNPAGGTNWVVTLPGAGASTPGSAQFSSPTIGPDGTIYSGSVNSQLFSIAPEGRTNWTLNLGAETYSSPSIGLDGTIYLGCDDGNLYAVDWHGAKKWTFPVSGLMDSSAAVSSDGTVYTASVQGGGMFALSSSGVNQGFTSLSQISASAAIAKDGRIYIPTINGTLYALSYATHTNLWTFSTNGSQMFSSPAIGEDGTIYIGAGSRLFALYETNSLQNSAWPSFRRESSHKARSIQRGLNPPIISSKGDAVMRLTVEPGRIYSVDSTTDLVTWAESTNFMATASTNIFVDAGATNFTSRFYRLRTE